MEWQLCGKVAKLLPEICNMLCTEKRGKLFSDWMDPLADLVCFTKYVHYGVVCKTFPVVNQEKYPHTSLDENKNMALSSITSIRIAIFGFR